VGLRYVWDGPSGVDLAALYAMEGATITSGTVAGGVGDVWSTLHPTRNSSAAMVGPALCRFPASRYAARGAGFSGAEGRKGETAVG